MREKKDINIEIGGNIAASLPFAGRQCGPNYLWDRRARNGSPCACQTYFGYKAGIPATGSRAAVRYFEYVIKKEPLPPPKTGIDRGSWFVFRAFKQVPKSTLISALKKKLRREYNHLGWSICVALRLAITGFFDP